MSGAARGVRRESLEDHPLVRRHRERSGRAATPDRLDADRLKLPALEAGAAGVGLVGIDRPVLPGS